MSTVDSYVQHGVRIKKRLAPELIPECGFGKVKKSARYFEMQRRFKRRAQHGRDVKPLVKDEREKINDMA